MTDSTEHPSTNYDLPYRGLPAEIRAIIWRYCLVKDVEVHGPYRETTLDDPQEMHDRSNLGEEVWQDLPDHDWTLTAFDPRRFHLRGGPDVAILQLNKQVYQEAQVYMKGGIFFDIRKILKKDQYEFFWWLSPRESNRTAPPLEPPDSRPTAACEFADMIGSTCPELHIDGHFQSPSAGISIGCWMKDMSEYSGLTRLVCQLDLDDPLIRAMANDYRYPFFIEPQDLIDPGFDGDIEDYDVELSDVVSVLQVKLLPFWEESDATRTIEMFNKGSLRTLKIIFSGVIKIMKRAVYDGGRSLLHFDKLTEESLKSISFEAATYSQPSTIHIAIKKGNQ